MNEETKKVDLECDCYYCGTEVSQQVRTYGITALGLGNLNFCSKYCVSQYLMESFLVIREK